MSEAIKRQLRIAAHQARIQAELATKRRAARQQRQTLARTEKVRAAPRQPNPCPDENRLVAAWIDRINMMARHFGWSLCLLLPAVCWGTNPIEDIARERVSEIEVNHYYSECGREQFTQVIFWHLHPYRERREVIAWRMLRHASQWPEYDWHRGDFGSVWQDGEVYREVRAGLFRESWTQDGYEGDPELIDRCVLPREKRRELTSRRGVGR